MKLEVLKQFNDAVAGKLRNVGETFEVDAKRGEQLLAHELNLVKEVAAKEVAKAETVETADKKPVVKRAKKPVAKK